MTTKLRVWHVPQIPGPAFHVAVRSLGEALFVINTLGLYDLFQLEHRIKPDYCNASGLLVFDPTDTEDGPNGSWVEWETEDGDNIGDLTDEQIEMLDA